VSDRRVDPTQAGAEERLGVLIRNVLVSVAVLALVGVLLPVEFGQPVESVAVALVVALPFGRVVWLVSRWWKQRDFRFVRWAILLLVLVAVGPVLALLGN
jgi:hypothetical protein